MKADQLRQLIADGERDTLEFKRSTGQRSRAMETLCAMLNSCGGRVVFGVNAAGALVGQELGAHALEEVGYGE